MQGHGDDKGFHIVAADKGDRSATGRHVPVHEDGTGPSGAAFPMNTSARPTMRDVAAAAGVGLTTVSRVVNGQGPVSGDTVHKVHRAISLLGFHRDEIARSLRPGQNSLTVGILLGDLTNPFWARLATGALQCLDRAGYAALVATADEDPERARRSIETLISRRVAGLIVVPEAADQAFLGGQGSAPRLPVVFVDRPARGPRTDVVTIDNDGGAALATRHLIEHGHRHIAIMVAPAYYTTGRRLRGYRRAIRRAGHDAMVITLEEGSAQAASETTASLLASDTPPTAIFTTTSFLTEGVLDALGPRCTSVAIVGFDDFRLAAQLPTPVTVVSADIEELGRRAAQLLLDRIDGHDGPPRRLVLPVCLTERGSGEIPPAQ